MGEQAFNSIHGTLTKKAIGMLMILAYNLMDDNVFRLIKKYDPVLVDIPSSIPIEDIQDHKLCKGQMKSMLTYLDFGDSDVFVETCRQRAIGYCYLAASYLRLFTKSADNYLKADKHLKGKFRDFYKFEFPFDKFHPDMDNLGVNCAQLGNAMHVPMFEPQLSAVSKLLELEHRPLKIAGLKDASQGDKDDARPIAARAMRLLRSETPKERFGKTKDGDICDLYALGDMITFVSTPMVTRQCLTFILEGGPCTNGADADCCKFLKDTKDWGPHVETTWSVCQELLIAGLLATYLNDCGVVEGSDPYC
ncbi:coat protein [Tanacetum coccineum]